MQKPPKTASAVWMLTSLFIALAGFVSFAGSGDPAQALPPAKIKPAALRPPAPAPISAPVSRRITLPIEVMGSDGTTVRVPVYVPNAAAPITTFWMQAHGLSYPDKASIQIGSGSWLPLDNQTAAVEEPGKSYGGIGGAFATLKLSLPLAPGQVHAGLNWIGFRFNHTDGVSIGFRVLQLQFKTAQGQPALSAAAFSAVDPRRWQAPLPDAVDIAAGKQLWHSAVLRQSNLVGASSMLATCSDCHTQDGRDLKYFNYSNYSIIERSEFHGLSELQGKQIASYIRTLKNADGSIIAAPGRPWNPPYQPGPGLDEQPVANWAAGAGVDAVLAKDSDMLPYLFPDGITPDVIATTKTLNIRELPIGLQLIDWNHWLPTIHPKDAWGSAFVNDNVNKMYQGEGTGSLPWNLRQGLSDPVHYPWAATPQLRDVFDLWEWTKADFLGTQAQAYNTASQASGAPWTPREANQVYSLAQWRMVKVWELMQEFHLEDKTKTLFSRPAEIRAWPSDGAFTATPATLFIPKGSSVLTSNLTYDYLDNSWYYLQMILNAGNRQRSGNDPIDWGYIPGPVKDLSNDSHVPEAMRLTTLLIKGMQEGDNGIGPNALYGWNPNQLSDLSLLVHPGMGNVISGFDTLPGGADTKKQVFQSMLSAWFDKAQQYTPDQYYAAGLASPSEDPTQYANDISFKMYNLTIPYMRTAGVDNTLLNAVCDWAKTMWPLGNWDSLKR